MGGLRRASARDGPYDRAASGWGRVSSDAADGQQGRLLDVVLPAVLVMAIGMAEPWLR